MTFSVHPETEPGSVFKFPPWSWDKPRHQEHFRRCSFCGSVNPEDLAAEPNWRAEWADQKYGWPHKFYVNIPNREPDKLFVTGSTNHFTEADRERGYVPFEELTEDQLAIIKRDEYKHAAKPGGALYFGTRPYHFGKFYTVHLGDTQLSPEVKRAVEQHSGLKFEFLPDGRVRWFSALQAL